MYRRRIGVDHAPSVDDGWQAPREWTDVAAESKLAARALMERSGVPVVPGGTPDDQSEAGIRRTAIEVGFPVLIKASAGGGGSRPATLPSPEPVPMLLWLQCLPG